MDMTHDAEGYQAIGHSQVRGMVWIVLYTVLSQRRAVRPDVIEQFVFVGDSLSHCGCNKSGYAPDTAGKPCVAVLTMKYDERVQGRRSFEGGGPSKVISLQGPPQRPPVRMRAHVLGGRCV